MATLPGEENIATLYADVHYFYGDPTARPRHHRFDKASYVYVFEDANTRKARIEIANGVGTEDQDAFTGYLDLTQVHFSYKQHTLVSLTVGNVADNPAEWHLPTFDPRNENKYHYKLHSLDIYFWTSQDAIQFVNNIRRILPPNQVTVLDEPAAPQQQPLTRFPPPPPPPPQQQPPSETNPIVSRLEENAASYAQGQPSRSGSTATDKSHPPQQFVPLAYNPAAPVAPEQLRPREKTPPPEDGLVNPLAVAVAIDAQQQQQQQQQQQVPYPPSLPHQQHAAVPGMVSTPGFSSPGFGRFPSTNRYPGTTAAPPPHLPTATQAPAGSLPPPPPGPPPPATSNRSTPAPPPPPQQQHQQQQQQQQQPHPQAVASSSTPQPGEYGIHQQVYQPAEGEKLASKPAAGKGRLEENAQKLEKGVSSMFRKFEKKFS